MRHVPDASAESLEAFVLASIQPGSVIHTDGWSGYGSLSAKGYGHDVTIIKRNNKTASELLPRVHRVFSLLKRWLLGTHQGHKHLDYYFYRLAQQAVAVDPIPYDRIVHPFLPKENHNL